MAKLPPALRQHTFDIPPEEGDLEQKPSQRLITPHLRPMFDQLRPWVFAVDPGQEHVGLAWTRFQSPLVGGETVGSRFQAATTTPDEAVDRFSIWGRAASDFVAQDPVLVIEEYRLYPDQVALHTGKTIPTAENIGAFKHVARVNGVRVVEQGSDIKRPMAGILTGRGLKALGDSRHAKDAELHLWYFCLGKTLPGLGGR